MDGGVAETDGDFCGSLDGVGVEESAGGFGDFGGGGDGLDDTGFVIGHHERDHGGAAWADGVAEFVEVDGAVGSGGEGSDFDAVGGLEGFEAIGDGVVFCGAGDEVIFFGVETACGEDGGVVGFGAAAGEDDFVGVAVEEGGGLFAGEVDGFADGFGGGVGAGGIGKVIFEEWEHGLEDGGVELGGGVVVEVDHAGWGLMVWGRLGCKAGEGWRDGRLRWG